MVRNETILLSLDQLTNWGILTTDADLNVTGWNGWLERSSGRPAGDMVGANLLALFPDLVSRRLDQFFRQALDGRVIVLAQRLHKYLLPFSVQAHLGVAAPMHQSVRIAPLLEDGLVVGTLTVIEDVTERVVHDAEMAVRARQQATVAVLGQHALAGDDLVSLSQDTATLLADMLKVDYCALWELAPTEPRLVLKAGVGWRAESLSEITVPVGTNSHEDYTMAMGKPVVSADLKNESRFSLTAFARQHDLHSGASVLVSGRESPVGVVAVYTACPRAFSDEDISFLQAAANVLGLAIDRKRLESQLRQRVAELADTDRRKDEFLAMLAHELRNPLAAISNSVRVLGLTKTADTNVQYAHDVIGRQMQQLTRMVDDLLDVSRITRGKVQLQREVIDLAGVVASAVEISRPLLDGRKHDFSLTLPSEPVCVLGDPTRLAQVIANILNNAAKYTNEGGAIAAILERTDREAVVRVRDSGLGIAPTMLGSVFDLFTQAQSSLSRSDGGLGIGLSLVRSLVQLHGGTVEAFSEGLGRGSEFVLRLPVISEAPAEPWKKNHAESPRPGSRRILVVDDNVDAAKSLAILLNMVGHEVHTAKDGTTALHAAQVHQPDVVLLDIGLPGMDGLEVARHLRQDQKFKDVLLVAITGYGQDEDRRRSEEAGFNAHLVKPIAIDALNALLGRFSADE